MRKALTLVPLFALAACNFTAGAQEDKGNSGPVTRQDFTVGDFDGVALAGSHDVIVTVGGAASVRAEGDADRIERLDIRVENGTLRVGSKKGAQWNFGTRRASVTIYVTTPKLVSAAVAGSGDMKIDKVEGDHFSASIAGSGDMEIASLRVNAAEFSVAGSGDIRAAGAVANTKVSIAGSGDVDVSGVDSKQANVSIVGSGDVKAKASETADVSILGSGSVNMSGGAKCIISKRGSGDVTCG